MREWAERAAGWLVPERNPDGVVYGIIVIAALLAAESDLHETYVDAAASAAIAASLYWLAHAYAGLLGGRLRAQRRLTAAVLARELRHDLAIVRGAALPLAVLAVAWVARVPQHTGVTAALWSAIASLVAFELLAGLRSHASLRELALDALVGAAMGIGVLAVKIVLH